MTDLTGARLSRRYRELATERSPAELDRRLLAAAREAVASESPLRRWRAPLATAATVALGLTLVLELTRMPGEESGPVAGDERALRQPAREADAGMLEDGLRRMSSESERRARDALPFSSLASERAGDAARKSVAGEAESGASAGPAAEDCERRRESAERWRACIEALDAAGDPEAAARERAALEQAFPPEPRPAEPAPSRD